MLGELADQAAEDDDRQRAEQDVGEHALPSRLAPGDHRREEDAGREERGRDEEDRQLDVPGARRGCRGRPGRGRCRRSRRARPGSAGRPRRPASGAGTAPPSRGRTRRSRAGPGVSATSPGRAEGERRLLAAPASRGSSSGRRPRTAARSRRAGRSARQRSRRSRWRVGVVAHQRLGRPVVRVGVVVARAPRRRRPGRPGEERRQLLDLLRIGDRVRAAGRTGSVGSPKKSRVVRRSCSNARACAAREGERVGVRVVAVGLELGRSSRCRRRSEPWPP